MSCKSCIRAPCPFTGSDGPAIYRYGYQGCCNDSPCDSYGYVGPYSSDCHCKHKHHDRAYDDRICAYKFQCKKKCKVYKKTYKKKSKCGCK